MIIVPLVNFLVGASAYWLFQKLVGAPVDPGMVGGILTGCIISAPVFKIK